MSYCLEEDLENNLVTARYEASTTLQDRIGLLEELVSIMKDKQQLNILIDIRKATQNMTPEEQIEYGDLVASKQKYFLHSRMAILSDKDKNPHPLIIPIAHVGGFRGICEFHNETEAMHWLNGELR